MVDEGGPVSTRRELGHAGSDERRYSFHVELNRAHKPFVFQYRQGNNARESGARTATLEEMRDAWPSFTAELLDCNCSWAIPIVERGFQSMDTGATLLRLLEWSDGLRDVQLER